MQGAARARSYAEFQDGECRELVEGEAAMSWSNQTNSLRGRGNRTCWRGRQKARRVRTTAENFTEMPGTCAGTARPEVKNPGGPSPVLPHATGATQPGIQANNLHP